MDSATIIGLLAGTVTVLLVVTAGIVLYKKRENKRYIEDVENELNEQSHVEDKSLNSDIVTPTPEEADNVWVDPDQRNP